MHVNPKRVICREILTMVPKALTSKPSIFERANSASNSLPTSSAIAIACQRCGRYGRYNVARLIAAHGADAKLTDLPVTLANCEKARSVSVHDRCKARFEGFSFRA
jgi:hypothetical protein